MNLKKNTTTGGETVSISYAHGEADFSDLVHVVRCKDCINAVKPDKHAELPSTVLHCTAYRGEEVRYVWHKYKKYYKDYSLVFDDEYCSFGVRKDG